MWTGRSSELVTARLRTHGRISWAALAAALTGATTAWADYDGFHLGAAPGAAPPYTHLWGWAEGWLLRARLDSGCAIVATLHLDESAPSGLPPGPRTEAVRATYRQSRTWPAGTPRVGQLEQEVRDQLVDLYQLDGDHPVTFVRISPAPEATNIPSENLC